MIKRPRAKVVNEQIPATRQREPRLPRFHAQDVRVEQAQIGPLFEVHQTDRLQDVTLQKQAEARQPVHFNPLAFALLPKVARERMHGLHVQERLADAESPGAFPLPWLHPVRHRLNELPHRSIVRHRADHADHGRATRQADELVQPARISLDGSPKSL